MNWELRCLQLLTIEKPFTSRLSLSTISSYHEARIDIWYESRIYVITWHQMLHYELILEFYVFNRYFKTEIKNY